MHLTWIKDKRSLTHLFYGKLKHGRIQKDKLDEYSKSYSKTLNG